MVSIVVRLALIPVGTVKTRELGTQLHTLTLRMGLSLIHPSESIVILVKTIRIAKPRRRLKYAEKESLVILHVKQLYRVELAQTEYRKITNLWHSSRIDRKHYPMT